MATRTLTHADYSRVAKRLAQLNDWSIYKYPSYKRHMQHDKNVNVPKPTGKKWITLMDINNDAATNDALSTTNASTDAVQADDPLDTKGEMEPSDDEKGTVDADVDMSDNSINLPPS